MKSLKVMNDICRGCMKCVRECPFGALQINGKYPEINTNKCRQCMRCIAVCPVNAIKIVE